MKKNILSLIALLSFLCMLLTAPAVAEDDVLVFAAASTTNAITDICQLFNEQGQGQAQASFASSSTLAKQIESGAPAQIYLSANVKWMDYVEDLDLIESETRLDLLGNRIVIIAPANVNLAELIVDSNLDLAFYLGDGRLAMGDPEHVPAGIYAKESLVNLGLWDQVESKITAAKDVRAALALVERGECPLGMVYSTDAAISDQVQVVGVVPEDAHTPIVYPVAILKNQNRAGVLAFFEMLQSPESRAIFEGYGFSVR